MKITLTTQVTMFCWTDLEGTGLVEAAKGRTYLVAAENEDRARTAIAYFMNCQWSDDRFAGERVREVRHRDDFTKVRVLEFDRC